MAGAPAWLAVGGGRGATVLARQAIGFALGGFALVVTYYVIPQAYVGRGVLGIALVFGFVAVTTFRAAFLRLVEVEVFKRRILVLGAGERASQIHNRLRRRRTHPLPCLTRERCLVRFQQKIRRTPQRAVRRPPFPGTHIPRRSRDHTVMQRLRKR